MKKIILIALVVMNSIYSSFGQKEIILEHYFRSLKSVKVKIDGKPYRFLFDTGAGITMVSPEIAIKTGKMIYGNNTGFRMSGEKVEIKLCDSLNIKIGGINFFHPYVGVFDMMRLLPKELERIDGIISLKTFAEEAITLDLKDDKLVIETVDSYKKKTNNLTLIPSRFVNGHNGSELNIFIGIKALNHLWWFLFDSGNISKVKISKSIAAEWNLTFNEDGITELGNYTFALAGDSIIAPTIIDYIIYDGALSFDFIRQSAYTLNFEEEKVWIKNRSLNSKNDF